VWWLVVAIVAVAFLGPQASADIEDVSGTNIQEGRNRGSTRQSGDADAGEAVTGQTIGVQAGGGATVRARNRVERASARSGDADADNDISAAVGHLASEEEVGVGSISDSDGVNILEGDNRLRTSQSADANTGNAVIGQTIGVVADGDVVIDATHRSRDTIARSGDADADNDVHSFVGLASATGPISIGTISGVTGVNIQEGDNTFSESQSADANTGDGSTGQVIAASSTNGTVDISADADVEDSIAETGDADEDNDADSLTGHVSSLGGIFVSDLIGDFLTSP